MLTRRLNIGVRNAERATVADLENFGGPGSFLDSRFGTAAGAHFAGSEVEDACFVALLRGFEQRAAAGQLDVVGMRGDGEDVEGHGCSVDAQVEIVSGRVEEFKS